MDITTLLTNLGSAIGILGAVATCVWFACKSAIAPMQTNIQNMKESIKEIKDQNSCIEKQINSLSTSVAEINASTKSAHKRIDELQNEHNRFTTSSHIGA